MLITLPRIIAPDTSHWAKWIDAALGRDFERRAIAQGFHERLLSSGRIPFLSWHHLEELLAIADDASASRRVAFIQSLPMVAFMRLPSDSVHIGSIIDVIGAEVSAVLNGNENLQAVRTDARKMLIRTGTGREAIGDEGWVWDVVRPEFQERRESAKLVAATRSMNLFDDKRTVGEIAKGSIRAPDDMAHRLTGMHHEIHTHIRTRGDAEIADPRAMTASFMQGVQSFSLPDGINVRDLIELALTSQGVEPYEIADDCLLSDLNNLALFRASLKVVAEKIGRPFADIKHVDMRLLPSWQIERALTKFGQDRLRRNGSDVNDGHLATLAAYVDELFVDKRTAEDFRRVTNRKDDIASLICAIRKASDFEALANAG